MKDYLSAWHACVYAGRWKGEDDPSGMLHLHCAAYGHSFRPGGGGGSDG